MDRIVYVLNIYKRRLDIQPISERTTKGHHVISKFKTISS